MGQNTTASPEKAPLRDTDRGALRNLADSASHEEGSAPFMDPTFKKGQSKKSQPPPKMGRPSEEDKRKEKEDADRESIEGLKQLTRPAWSFLSRVGEALAGPQGKLTTEEEGTLVHTSACCLHRYLGTVGEHADLVTMLVVSGLWTGRVYMLKTERAMRDVTPDAPPPKADPGFPTEPVDMKH